MLHVWSLAGRSAGLTLTDRHRRFAGPAASDWKPRTPGQPAKNRPRETAKGKNRYQRIQWVAVAGHRTVHKGAHQEQHQRRSGQENGWPRGRIATGDDT